MDTWLSWRPWFRILLRVTSDAGSAFRKNMADQQRQLKLVAFVGVVIALGIGLATGQAAGGQELRSRLELVGTSVPLSERAGSDDGLAFAIQFMGDTHGTLDTCG